MEDVARFRAKCRREGIVEQALPPEPLQQLRLWLEQSLSCGIYEASAAVLATVNANSEVSARYVRVIGIDTGLLFTTSLTSRKAQDLEQHPNASLCFGWHEVARQVRIQGPTKRLSSAEADAFFGSLARDQQLLAWASDQASVVSDRAELARSAEAARARFGAAGIARPAQWGGYRLIPTEVEFWQGRADTLHDRLRYTRSLDTDSWLLHRVAP